MGWCADRDAHLSTRDAFDRIYLRRPESALPCEFTLCRSQRRVGIAALITRNHMTATTHLIPMPEPDYHAAKREYIDQYGSVLVMNTYLKVTVLVQSLVVLALVGLNVKTYQAFKHVEPLVIRINEVGRAEAVRYQDFQYQPQEAELKYFLIEFIQRHYSRMRATVRENYA